ncbi:hypothetical protein FKM82_020378 [Ascaphus truei]
MLLPDYKETPKLDKKDAKGEEEEEAEKERRQAPNLFWLQAKGSQRIIWPLSSVWIPFERLVSFMGDRLGRRKKLSWDIKDMDLWKMWMIPQMDSPLQSKKSGSSQYSG